MQAVRLAPPLSSSESLSAVMGWLYRSISIITSSRQLLPDDCFRDTAPGLTSEQLSIDSFSKARLPAINSKEPPQKLLIRGRSRANTLIDHLMTRILDGLRCKKLKAVELVIKERPSCPQQVLESYTFTVGHDGYLNLHSMLDISTGEVPMTTALRDINTSLRDLQRTLAQLPALPDIRFMLLHLFWDHSANLEASDRWETVEGETRYAWPLERGWVKQQLVQSPVRLGNQEYKGMSINAAFLKSHEVSNATRSGSRPRFEYGNATDNSSDNVRDFSSSFPPVRTTEAAAEDDENKYPTTRMASSSDPCGGRTVPGPTQDTVVSTGDLRRKASLLNMRRAQQDPHDGTQARLTESCDTSLSSAAPASSLPQPVQADDTTGENPRKRTRTRQQSYEETSSKPVSYGKRTTAQISEARVAITPRARPSKRSPFQKLANGRASSLTHAKAKMGEEEIGLLNACQGFTTPR